MIRTKRRTRPRYERLAVQLSAMIVAIASASRGSAADLGEFWTLRPDRWQVPVGQSIRLHTLHGWDAALSRDQIETPSENPRRERDASKPADATSPAGAPDAVDRIFATTGATRANLPHPQRGGDNAFELSLDSPGVVVIGADAARHSETLSRDALAGLLARHTSQTPAAIRLDAAPQQVLVRRIACGRTLVRAGDAPNRLASSAALAKSGQAAEIRLLLDPTVMDVGGDLPVRVYVDGAAAEGVRTIAEHVPTSRRQTLYSNVDGFCNVRIDAAGEWRIAYTHVTAGPLLEPGERPEECCDFRVFTGSVSFLVPESAGGGE